MCRTRMEVHDAIRYCLRIGVAGGAYNESSSQLVSKYNAYIAVGRAAMGFWVALVDNVDDMS